MAVSMDVIKRVIVQGSSEGLDKLEGELRKIAASSDGVSVSFEKASRSQLSAEAAYKRLSASIDPTDKAQQQITRSTSTLDRALQQGIITQTEYAKRLEQVREKYSSAVAANDNMANSSKLARYELINLSRQVQDVGVSLYSGQPAMTVFIQQGSQIADVFASSKASLADFGRQVLGFVARNPFLVLAGGVAALGAGVLAAASYLNNYVKVLDDLSQSSGIAAKDLSQLRESAAIKGISNADFVSGVNAVADKIAEAKKGTNELGQLFRLNGKAISDNVTNLYTVADLVKNAADYQDKKNILEAAGLSTTAESVRYYSQGAEELRKQKEATAGFGDDTKKLADNARAFDEAWNKAWESFKTYAINSIAEVINALKQLVADPTVQAIISFLSLTPGEAYAAWKGAVTRTLDRARGYSAGAEAFGLSYPSASSIKPELTPYGPDLPKVTETTKALKEQMRVLQDRITLLGESASAEDKLALAELKIKQALLEKVPLSDKDIANIKANAVAVKETTDKAGEALRRANEARQEAIEKLELEIKNTFRSAEAAKAEKIALEEIYRLKKAGVPENRIPYDDIYSNAKSRAAAQQQIEDLGKVKDAIKSFKDAGVSIGTDFVKDMLAGASAMDALGNAALRAGQQLEDQGLTNALKGLLSGNLVQAGIGAVQFGVGAALEWFGKSKQEADQAAQAAAQAAQQLAEAQKQWASMAGQFSNWIKEWTTGFSGELSKAIDSARNQMQQFADAASKAQNSAGVAAAQNAFNEGVNRSIIEAIKALGDYGSESSDTAKAIKEVNDKAKDLTDVLIEFGTSAADAADVVNRQLNYALGQLVTKFTDDLARKINDLVGGGWVNQLNDLVSEVVKLRQDAASLGVQTSLIDTYYVLAAQQVIDNNKLTGDSFNAVALTLGPLGSQLHEFSAAVEDTAQAVKRSTEQIQQAIQGYQDQLFVLQQDQQTLAGALAVFDLQAQRAREEEIRLGGQALTALEALQAQQRLNIIADFNKRAIEAQQRADEERLRQQQQAAEEQKRIWDEAAKFLQGALQNIQNWISSFLAGSQSPLSPSARLASAQSTFSTQYSAALGGDRDALSGITGNAQSLVEAIRSVYGSTTAGQTLINSMLSQLQALPSQVSPEQFIVNNLTPPLQDITSAINDMKVDIGAAIATDNPQNIAQALSTYFNAIDSNTDGLLTSTELTSALGADYATGVLHAIDQNGDGMISRAEVINQSLGGSTTTAGDSISGIDSNTTPLRSNVASSPFDSLIQSIAGVGGTNSFLSSLLGNLGGTSHNPADDLSAMRGLLNTTTGGWLATLSNQIGSTLISGTLMGTTEKVRYNLESQNREWRVGWAPAGSIWAPGTGGAAISYLEKGGVIDGPRHAYGGVLVNAEGGEYVVNRHDTARFRGVLDQINFGHRPPAANDNADIIRRLDSLERAIVGATMANAEIVSNNIAELNKTQTELNKRTRVKAAAR